MENYFIPVHAAQAVQQQKAAKLIHLLVAFLLIANAWGAFQSTPHPRLFFVVSQIALSILILSLVAGGKKLFPNQGKTHRLFRLIEAGGFAYAAYFFYTEMHGGILSFLQAVIAAGLLYLWFHERKIYRPQQVTLTIEGIELPAILNAKKLEWKEIENIRLRNDYLSINTRANKFIQFEVATTYSEVELDAMNAWCFRQLIANGVEPNQ